MLSGNVRWQDLSKSPSFDNNSIRFGESSIVFCQHKYIRTEFFKAQFGYFFLTSFQPVLQKNKNEKVEVNIQITDDEISDRIKSLEDAGRDFVAMEISTFSPVGLRLRCGGRGMLPIFYSVTGDQIDFDWDYNRLVGSRNLLSLDLQVLVNRLSGIFHYSPRTLVWEVSLLTERSRLTFSSEGFSHVLPSEDDKITRLDNVDWEVAEDAVKRAISQEIIQSGGTADDIACELSGGIDSAVVATLAESVFGKDLKTLGLLVESAEVKEQEQRRSELISSFSARDYAKRLIDPHVDIFSEKTNPDELFEMFIMGFDEIWSHAKNNGASLILNGAGGNELSPTLESDSASPDELVGDILSNYSRSLLDSHFHALPPPGVISATSFIALQFHAAPMFKHGLLQVSPLTSPIVAALFKTLPLKMVDDRFILRKIISDKINSKTFLDKYNKESFGLVVYNGINNRGDNKKEMAKIESNSRLLELGVVDQKRLRENFEQAGNPKNFAALRRISLFINLERWLSKNSFHVFR